MPTLFRRTLSISLVSMLGVVLLIAAPIALPLCYVASKITSWTSAHRVYVFALIFVACEIAGVLAATYLWIRYRTGQRFLDANRHLQHWWASALQRGGAWSFSVTFEFSGLAETTGDPCVVIPRHTSIADTVLPMNFYAAHFDIPMRYVLKKELLWDPCLDIVGNRLPNFFIDRSGFDTEGEVARLAAFVSDMSDTEGLVFYPEGTRYTPEKRAQVLNKLVGTKIGDRMATWPDLLPPRLSGTQAVLENNPGKDLLLIAHSGFEGSSNLASLCRGAWTHETVRIQAWRIPFERTRADSDTETLAYSLWDEMQQALDSLGSVPSARSD